MQIHVLILTAGLALAILSDTNAETLYGVFGLIISTALYLRDRRTPAMSG